MVRYFVTILHMRTRIVANDSEHPLAARCEWLKLGHETKSQSSNILVGMPKIFSQSITKGVKFVENPEVVSISSHLSPAYLINSPEAPFSPVCAVPGLYFQGSFDPEARKQLGHAAR
jgi:hypothetical protein